MKSVLNSVRDMFRSLGRELSNMTRGITRSFAPEHDDYPETGVRPLKHDVHHEREERKKRRHRLWRH